MNIYESLPFSEVVAGNSYPGRGILLGKTPDGKKAAIAYFIMGRSENSRNRIFTEKDGQVTIYPFDESKLCDPSLVIYSPVRTIGDYLIVTNGDQTDTIYDHLAADKTFEQALETRCFEPDGPNFTPRISGLIRFKGRDFTYKLSILKSADAAGTACSRFTFSYPALPGTGHFIRTYNCDGAPIPTFTGEPVRVKMGGDLDGFTNMVWSSLNEENRVSLYTRFVDLTTGTFESRIINKNQ